MPAYAKDRRLTRHYEEVSRWTSKSRLEEAMEIFRAQPNLRATVTSLSRNIRGNLVYCALRVHSMRIFAALMTFAHLSRSLRMYAANSAGLLLAVASMPPFR
jgi:hypothetical protein